MLHIIIYIKLILKRIVVILSLFLASVNVDAFSQQTQWQETKHAVQPESDVEITGKDGVIVIRTARRIQVRVFTILGQLVSQNVVNPGESGLKVSSRGIYIVKVENRTFKVAL